MPDIYAITSIEWSGYGKVAGGAVKAVKEFFILYKLNSASPWSLYSHPNFLVPESVSVILTQIYNHCHHLTRFYSFYKIQHENSHLCSEEFIPLGFLCSY